MFEKRKVVAVVLLMAFSVGLTAGGQILLMLLSGEGHSLRPYPFLSGLGAVAGGLLLHVCLIRRILPIHRTPTQVLGLLISGFLAIVLWAVLLESPKDLAGFVSRLPSLFWLAIFSGILWFPVLTLLELWAYCGTSREQARRSLTKTAEELP